MVRERKIQKTEEVEEQVVKPAKDERPLWKVKSGGITLLDGRYFEKDQTFRAWQEEISESFRDIIIPMEPLVTRATRVRPIYSLQEVVPTADEEDDENYVQLFNIVNADGKVISQKPMPKEEADPLLKAMNS